jgi:hypothetical protein
MVITVCSGNGMSARRFVAAVLGERSPKFKGATAIADNQAWTMPSSYSCSRWVVASTSQQSVRSSAP